MRRQFLRDQKESIRRQRKEMRLKLKKDVSQNRGSFFDRIQRFFSGLLSARPVKIQPDHQHKAKRPGLLATWAMIYEERRNRKREKIRNLERIRMMKKKIGQERRQYFLLRLRKFIRNPFPVRKISNDQKYIIELAKRERKKQLRQKLKNYPANMRMHTVRFWKNRWNNLTSAWVSAMRFFSEFMLVAANRVLSREYLITTLNSLVMFILSFLLLYFLHQVVTIIAASYYEIPTVLYSYRIYWPLYTYSTLYTRGALIVIFGIGPALCLILAFVFYRIFLIIKGRTRLWRSFFFWGTAHGLNLFFGSYIVGVITRTGFIYTSEWLFLSNIFDPEEIMFLIIAFIALIVAGYLATRHVITMADTDHMIVPRVRVFYLISKLLLPWFLGNICLYAINFPNNPFELWLLYAISLLVVLPMFVNYNSTLNLNLRTLDVKNKFRIGWEFVIATVVALVLLRLFLFNGITYS